MDEDCEEEEDSDEEDESDDEGDDVQMDLTEEVKLPSNNNNSLYTSKRPVRANFFFSTL